MEFDLESITPEERQELERNVFMGTLDQLKAWARSNSLWPLTFGLACCAIEMMGRLGSVASPMTSTGSGSFSERPAPIGCHDRSRYRNEEDRALLRRLYDKCLNPNGSSPWAPAPLQGDRISSLTPL